MAAELFSSALSQKAFPLSLLCCQLSLHYVPREVALRKDHQVTVGSVRGYGMQVGREGRSSVALGWWAGQLAIRPWWPPALYPCALWLGNPWASWGSPAHKARSRWRGCTDRLAPADCGTWRKQSTWHGRRSERPASHNRWPGSSGHNQSRHPMCQTTCKGKQEKKTISHHCTQTVATLIATKMQPLSSGTENAMDGTKANTLKVCWGQLATEKN